VNNPVVETFNDPFGVIGYQHTGEVRIHIVARQELRKPKAKKRKK
jgi:hypothetical protein